MEGAGENVDDFKGINGVSKRFMREKEEDGEIELSLGLSMNGRFGIDPTSKKLKRSSTDPQAREVAPLVRACSVPPLECKENGNCSEDVGLHAASSGVSHLQELLLNEAPTMAAADPDLDPVMRDEDSLRNTLTDMPYVFTGANDDRIEGFLYRFKMEEDLKIVCVCHGLFLSPAEFVKHGGGGDVAYPLKHIVVNPSPLY